MVKTVGIIPHTKSILMVIGYHKDASQVNMATAALARRLGPIASRSRHGSCVCESILIPLDSCLE